MSSYIKFFISEFPAFRYWDTLNLTSIARSFDFEITCMILAQIALHSVKLPLRIGLHSVLLPLLIS